MGETFAVYSESNLSLVLLFFTHKKHPRGARIHDIKESFPLKPSLDNINISFVFFSLFISKFFGLSAFCGPGSWAGLLCNPRKSVCRHGANQIYFIASLEKSFSALLLFLFFYYNWSMNLIHICNSSSEKIPPFCRFESCWLCSCKSQPMKKLVSDLFWLFRRNNPLW